MTTYSVPYGKKKLAFDLPDHLNVELVAPLKVKPSRNPKQIVTNAISSPIGDFSWNDFVGVKSVVIAINDKTRPVPHQFLLPPLLRKLKELGIKSENITLLIATGAHPPMGVEEFSAVVPAEILEEYSFYCHNCDDMENLSYLGETARGTSVWCNRKFLDADLRIVVGNIEPHQFQGFSGGVKSAAIGLAGRDTINKNHALMMDKKARLGKYANNPAREDVEEIGKIIGVHLALNAVLNGEKEIVEVLAGDPVGVMRAGIILAQEICQVPVDHLFDLMIVSPGGYPKDINVYQSQKAIAHAALVIRPGGMMILAAACSEGTGSVKYEQWVQHVKTNEALLQRFQNEEFRVGPHKAFQIARDVSRFTFYLVSDMEGDFVRTLLITPKQTIEEGLAALLPNLRKDAIVGVMPWANATIPIVQKNGDF